MQWCKWKACKTYLYSFLRLTFSPFRAGIVFIRQNLTSVDDPSAERIKLFIMTVDP